MSELPARWVQFGDVGFLVRYASKKEYARLRRDVLRRGLVKSFRWPPAFNDNKEVARLFAKRFVLDWRGNIQPPKPYSPELMASALVNVDGLGEALLAAIEDRQAFVREAEHG